MTNTATGPMPAPFTLVKTRFQRGVWQGRLTAQDPIDEAPELRLMQDGQAHPAPQVTAAAGEGNAWDVQVNIPISALSDGVSVFLVTDAASGAVLMRLPVLAGEDLADDLRAEVAVLRAELDQLRGAFQTAMRDRSSQD